MSGRNKKGLGRTLRGCVDWNKKLETGKIKAYSRTLRGCVDWNCRISPQTLRTLPVAPFAGAWIEIKHSRCNNPQIHVAPFAGAWIEMTIFDQIWPSNTVAPFAGAWIEIYWVWNWREYRCSRTLRGCVDWNRPILKDYQDKFDVAPFAGAWIEIQPIRYEGVTSNASHPSRVRGLKYCLICFTSCSSNQSHPSRVRGLKYKWLEEEIEFIRVAPFAGAWIEIIQEYFNPQPEKVAPFAGAWIEIKAPKNLSSNDTRRTLRGCVDWNHSLTSFNEIFFRRTPRECVDWNILALCANLNTRDVALPVSAWIEIKFWILG